MWFLDVKKINKTGGGSVGDAKFFCASDQDRQDQKEVKEGKKGRTGRSSSCSYVLK